MIDLEETAAAAGFVALKISKKGLREIYSSLRSFAMAWGKERRTFSVMDLTPEDRELLAARSRFDLSKIRKHCERHQIQVLMFDKSRFPPLLREIPCTPFLLFVRGNPELLTSDHPVAVVGARKMTDYGKAVLEEIIPPLVKAGCTIISGLAHGIDSESQKIALRYGGHCIAVLGSGVDMIYPCEQRTLAQEILESDGVIVSEYGLGAPPQKEFFPARNRIISGLSKAILVIEAKKKSGSLITAQFALDQNRELFAVPGNIFLESQEGTNRLIAQGAIPITSSSDLLEQLGFATTATSPAQIPSFASPQEQLIYEQLSEPRSIDELALRTSLALKDLSSVLSLMELKGIAQHLGSHRYCRATLAQG